MANKLSKSELEEYKQYVSTRLNQIMPILQEYAIGNFSKSIEIPEKEDEFTELLVGLDLMREDTQELVKREANMLARLNHRVAEMTEVIQSIASGNFTARAEVTSKLDVIDALAIGINMLAEELEVSTIGIEYVNNRIDKILEVVQRCAQGDYGYCELSEKNDSFDAFAIGLNMMIDDIKSNFEALDKANRELQAAQEASLNIMEDLDNQRKELETLNKQLQQEIAERKRIETMLRESEEKYRTIFNLAPDMIIIMDLNSNLLEANDYGLNIVGMSRAEVIGKSIMELGIFDTEDLEKYAELISQVSYGEFCGSIEIKVISKDKKIHWLNTRMGILKKDNVIFAVQIIGHDITERKLIENALKASDEQLKIQNEAIVEKNRKLLEHEKKLKDVNEELETYVYTVSHDLKSPIVSLQGFASLLEKEYKDKLAGDGLFYIERLKANADFMEHLILDLLELSRVGRVAAPFKNITLSEILEESLDKFKFIIEDKKIELILPNTMPVIYCDKTRIIQVFMNLISNSIKYVDENTIPKIEIDWTNVDDNNFIQVHIKDNGIGIDKEYHNKIFQIFQRLPEAKEKDPKGTGIGLSIVKKIIEVHGGKIWLESEKGRGTTFYFTLPKASKTENKAIDARLKPQKKE